MAEYRKKVWLKDTWNGGEVYEEISLIFTHIQNGKIKGRFLENGIIEPDLNLYSTGSKYYGNIEGKYENNSAECIMKQNGEDVGKLYISLQNEDLIKMDIELKGEKQSLTYASDFKPYNLKEIELDPRSEFNDNISKINLNKWGQIKFVSMIRTSTRRKTLFLYLTDNDENILYNFSEPMGFPTDFKVNEFLFQDINKDGRKDLLLVLKGITDSTLHLARVYEQNKMGGFEMNTKKTNKLNNGAEAYNRSIQDVLHGLGINYK